MKQLTTLAVIAPGTSVDIMLNTVSHFKDVVITFEKDIEKAIEQISTGNYQLLIIDKNLQSQDYNKLNKVSDVLLPDAAVVNMALTDEEFIRFKLSGLLSKWNDAQQNTSRKFIDNPGFGSQPISMETA